MCTLNFPNPWVFFDVQVSTFRHHIFFFSPHFSLNVKFLRKASSTLIVKLDKWNPSCTLCMSTCECCVCLFVLSENSLFLNHHVSVLSVRRRWLNPLQLFMWHHSTDLTLSALPLLSDVRFRATVELISQVRARRPRSYLPQVNMLLRSSPAINHGDVSVLSHLALVINQKRLVNFIIHPNVRHIFTLSLWRWGRAHDDCTREAAKIQLRVRAALYEGGFSGRVCTDAHRECVSCKKGWTSREKAGDEFVGLRRPRQSPDLNRARKHHSNHVSRFLLKGNPLSSRSLWALTQMWNKTIRTFRLKDLWLLWKSKLHGI